ncbi:hypothetical protein N9W34_04800 [Rickettsiales bacterium]|nr:hypothetical protein [Rickettsiales bacterium]
MSMSKVMQSLGNTLMGTRTGSSSAAANGLSLFFSTSTQAEARRVGPGHESIIHMAHCEDGIKIATGVSSNNRLRKISASAVNTYEGSKLSAHGASVIRRPFAIMFNKEQIDQLNKDGQKAIEVLAVFYGNAGTDLDTTLVDEFKKGILVTEINYQTNHLKPGHLSNSSKISIAISESMKANAENDGQEKDFNEVCLLVTEPFKFNFGVNMAAQSTVDHYLSSRAFDPTCHSNIRSLGKIIEEHRDRIEGFNLLIDQEVKGKNPTLGIIHFKTSLELIDEIIYREKESGKGEGSLGALLELREQEELREKEKLYEEAYKEIFEKEYQPEDGDLTLEEAYKEAYKEIFEKEYQPKDGDLTLEKSGKETMGGFVEKILKEAEQIEHKR